MKLLNENMSSGPCHIPRVVNMWRESKITGLEV